MNRPAKFEVRSLDFFGTIRLLEVQQFRGLLTLATTPFRKKILTSHVLAFDAQMGYMTWLRPLFEKV